MLASGRSYGTVRFCRFARVEAADTTTSDGISQQSEIVPRRVTRQSRQCRIAFDVAGNIVSPAPRWRCCRCRGRLLFAAANSNPQRGRAFSYATPAGTVRPLATTDRTSPQELPDRRDDPPSIPAHDGHQDGQQGRPSTRRGHVHHATAHRAPASNSRSPSITS
jgi:hypothetical protein